MSKDVNDHFREGNIKGPASGEGEVLGPEGEPKAVLPSLDLDASLARIDRRRAGEEKPIALPWASAHEQFGGGLWPGLHVVVGGTGAGKSTFALQCALSAAKAGHPVAYIGLELDPLQIDCRLIALEAGLEWSTLYLGRHTEEQRVKATKAAESLRGLPVRVVFPEAKGWPASALSEACERLTEELGGERHPLLVLDYLQLLGDEGGKRMELRERIGNAAYYAREVARKHNASVLALSSTARNCYGIVGGNESALKASGLLFDGHLDGRTNEMAKRWLVGTDELVGVGKESGDVEFAADSVSVLIRDPANTDRRTTVLATAKGRATGSGWCALSFNGTRFDDAPRESIRVYQHFQAELQNGKGKAKPRATEEDRAEEERRAASLARAIR